MENDMSPRQVFYRPCHLVRALREHIVHLVLLSIATLVLSGFGATAFAANKPPITLYAGQHQQMVRLLVRAFEKQTGVTVKVRNGEGPELANQIIREGKQTPADVFFTENSPELVRLQEKNLLAPVDKSTLARIPSRYNSDKGLWVGVLARENVLTYNPNMIDKRALPNSILALAKPKWRGKIGIHLTSSDIMPLIRAVAIKAGRHKALKWLEGIKRNAKLYQHSTGTVAAVNNGDVAVGISNSYYYYRLREQVGRKQMTSKVYHFGHGDPGGLINVSGAAVLKFAPHPKEAQRLLAFMVSKRAQRLLAHSTIDFEYPLRPGVSANPQLKPFNKLQPPDITVSQLGDDSEALQLLQQAGLL
jgi:iron(III) transport system substrate-binding protein